MSQESRREERATPTPALQHAIRPAPVAESTPGARAAPLRTLYLHAGAGEPGWIIGHPALAARVAWQVARPGSDSTLSRLWSGFRLAATCRCDVVVTQEYFCGLGMALGQALLRRRQPHIIWGLNQSRRLPGRGLPGRVANWAMKRVTLGVTHSRAEIALFEDHHPALRGKLHFSHWGYELPAVRPGRFSQREAPYVCMVGRNNRDYLTFAQAVRQARVHGVIIGSGIGRDLLGELRSLGVEVHQDLDFNDCLDCLRNALASAVLLRDDSRGAGHITMVSAMYMGVPQICTRAGVVADYFTEGEHGLSVPAGDAAAVADAIVLLQADPAARERMAASARAFAAAHFTNDGVAAAFSACLARVTAGPVADAATSRTAVPPAQA
jgi:glycosyltransferase involved in cell wall biosynthesis